MATVIPMPESFAAFLKAFPPEGGKGTPVDPETLRDFAKTKLGVAVPAELYEFWKANGSGYFGERDLYFFGDGSTTGQRDSFQDWNGKDFWAQVYPPATRGGPVFFAETCFGNQLGFRWDGGRCVFVLFAVDTFEAFVIAQSGNELFARVLSERFALTDPQRHAAVSAKLGPLQSGMHYAPILSPMLGGDGSAENFAFETANVHFRTAIQTFQGIRSATANRK